MKFFNLVAFALSIAAGSPAMAQQSQPVVEFDKVLADYQQVPVTENHKRLVIAERLEVRTRPIPEAAVLDVLRPGAMVGLVSEGGGWATMDLGGGFLGWMRSDGLKIVVEPQRAQTSKSAAAPIPRPRLDRTTDSVSHEQSTSLNTPQIKTYF